MSNTNDLPGIDAQSFKVHVNKDWFWHTRPKFPDPERGKLIFVNSYHKIVIDEKGQIFKWYISKESKKPIYVYMGSSYFEEDRIVPTAKESRFNQWEKSLNYE